jgi:hypothetical protein
MTKKSLNTILIVVLTHNRPSALYRCINTAIKNSSISSAAHWLIVDDSNKLLSKKNSQILFKFIKKGIRISHITREDREKISKTVSPLKTRYDTTFLKENERDISGLRNIGLLSSLILGNDLTFFIDDDIVLYAGKNNKKSFFDSVISHNQRHNFIIGANIGGILDESYNGRLWYLSDIGKAALLKHDKGLSNTTTRWNFKKNPLWRDVNSRYGNPTRVTHCSGGLMAFRLDTGCAIPFPRGYNEDWIWCLLQSMLCKTKIFKGKSWGIHAPPAIFTPNEKLALWEEFGEIIFSSLLAVVRKRNVFNIKKAGELTKQRNTSQKHVKEYKQLERSLNLLVKNSTSRYEREKLTAYLLQIKKTRINLENTNINLMIDNWFFDFIRRRSFFSSILKRRDICIKIANVLRDAKVPMVGQS